MLYFDHIMHSKKLPKKEDIIWLIPIRYWEPDEFGPEKFTVEEAYVENSKTGNGRLTLYGQFEKEKPNTSMYAAKEIDAQWYWSEENCRKAQLLLKEIHDIVFHDECDHSFDKFWEEEELE